MRRHYLEKVNIKYEIAQNKDTGKINGARICFNGKRYKNSQLSENNHFKNLQKKFGRHPDLVNIKCYDAKKFTKILFPIFSNAKNFEDLKEKIKKNNKLKSFDAELVERGGGYSVKINFNGEEKYIKGSSVNRKFSKQGMFSVFAENEVKQNFSSIKWRNHKRLTAFCKQIQYQRYTSEELKKVVSLGVDLIALESSAGFAKTIEELEKIKNSYEKLLENNPTQYFLIKNEINLVEKRITLLKKCELPEPPPKITEEDERNNEEENEQKRNIILYYLHKKNTGFAQKEKKPCGNLRIGESRGRDEVLVDMMNIPKDKMSKDDIQYIVQYVPDFVPKTSDEVILGEKEQLLLQKSKKYEANIANEEGTSHLPKIVDDLENMLEESHVYKPLTM